MTTSLIHLQVTSSILLTIFTLLAILHVYWAFGGKRWFKAAVPEVKGKPAFKPGPGITLVVAAGLFSFGVLALLLGFDLLATEPALLNYLAWGAATIFLLRSVGDFRHFGFFKFVGSSQASRGTTFARNDTRLYSPLCLLISSLFLILLIV